MRVHSLCRKGGVPAPWEQSSKAGPGPLGAAHPQGIVFIGALQAATLCCTARHSAGPAQARESPRDAHR